jgi:hypothetical protein
VYRSDTKIMKNNNKVQGAIRSRGKKESAGLRRSIHSGI